MQAGAWGGWRRLNPVVTPPGSHAARGPRTVGDVACGCGQMHLQLERPVEAGEQRRWQERVAVGPAEAGTGVRTRSRGPWKPTVRLVVRRPRHPLPRAPGCHHAADRHAQHPRIACQPEFLRRRGARHDAHAARHGASRKTCAAAPHRGIQPAPSTSRCRSGIVGQRQAGPRAGAIAAAAARPRPPPARRSAPARRAACGGRSQPLLALRNSQRLPSSR